MTIEYKVSNPDTHSMYFSIGAHPGFNCPLSKDETFEDYLLTCSPPQALACSILHEGILTGETYILPLKDQELPVSADLFANDALVMLNGQVDTVNLLSQKSGHGVSILSKDWPCYGIWSKKGTEKFVCLEPWYGVTDSEQVSGELSEKPYIIALGAGQQKIFQYSIRFF